MLIDCCNEIMLIEGNEQGDDEGKRLVGTANDMQLRRTHVRT